MESIELSAGGGVQLRVRPVAAAASCHVCAGRGVRVHSRYERRLEDVAIGGRRVEIRVKVRRFFCDSAACPAQTFVEQVDGLTSRYARRSPLLRQTLESIGLALCGRAGARLAGVLGAATSRSSMLRLVRAIPEPVVTGVDVLGVDDFALKRRHVYGTVLVDCQTRRVIDLLPGRDAATVASWLAAHPGAEVICRDRSGAYAEGARTGAPDAVQVADRFHLWQNLAAAVERCVARHKSCLPEPAIAQPDNARPGTVAVDPPLPAGPMAQRRREHHALIHGLLAQGLGIREITRHLGWGRHTVQRYARASTWQQMLAGRRRQPPSTLDPFKNHLRQHWTGRRGTIRSLHQEIAAQGFTGSYSTVRDFLRHCLAPAAPTLPAPPPSVRQATSWICRHPDHLTKADAMRLKTLLARCPELDTTASLVRSFAQMLTNRTGHELSAWIHAASQSGLSSFAQGLRHDLQAVTAGLTLHWNSGPVEGNVNRIKMLKRQMYGRANFDLLRKRVLMTN